MPLKSIDIKNFFNQQKCFVFFQYRRKAKTKKTSFKITLFLFLKIVLFKIAEAATTFSIVTFSITTLSIMTFNITTISILTFNITTFSMIVNTTKLSIMAFNITTLSIMTFNITTLRIMTLCIVVLITTLYT
jgi:hypothetical protein